LSPAQLIVIIAAVGLLGALHLALRAARVPAGAPPAAAPRPWPHRDPVLVVLVLAALAALAFAGVAFVVSMVDDEDTTAPTTQAATTTAPTTNTAPPPPQPPPPSPPTALEAPAGTALVARVVTGADGSVQAARNRVGSAPQAVERENGVYTVRVPGLSAELRRRAVVRVRPVDGTPGVRVSSRKMGPEAEFVVFTRDTQSGNFADNGFEFAVFLPRQELEVTAGDEQGRRHLPGTK
jgi:hypothetical protein